MLNCTPIFFSFVNMLKKQVFLYTMLISFSLQLFFSVYRSLVPVTQLYVSVDASTKDSLKKIDRPLFKDFWQRFLDSLRALGEKVGPLCLNPDKTRVFTLVEQLICFEHVILPSR